MTELTPVSACDHDHKKCVSTALKAAEKLCLERGVQLTQIRHQVLELILSSHCAVKAYDLLERLKPLQSSAKPATVYRALDFLIEQGLIHRIESLNAFVGCNNSGQRHEQLLLICKQCNEVEERPALNTMSVLAQEIESAGFVGQNKTIEIHGVCAKCQKKT